MSSGNYTYISLKSKVFSTFSISLGDSHISVTLLPHFSDSMVVCHPDVKSTSSPVSTVAIHQECEDLTDHSEETDDRNPEIPVKLQKNHGFVSESAVALRCRVMPPPCLRNPYLKDGSESNADPFANQRSKCAGSLYSAKCLDCLIFFWKMIVWF